MPGSFGTVDTDNGAFASTRASDHFGVFGSNESTAAPTGGGAGGAGVFGLSVSPGAAGVFGANNSPKGVGVQGNGPEAGLSGFSENGVGVRSHSNHANAVESFAHDSNGTAVLAINDATTSPTIIDQHPRGGGILGVTTVPGAAGVFGANNSPKGVGVQGNGPEAGVNGFSENGVGVRAHSNHSTGVEGFAHVVDQSGIFGMNDATGTVTDGLNRPAGNGVWGHTKVDKGSGIVGSVEPGLTKAAGVTGIGLVAGRFFGDVEVTGDIRLLNADCAEDFDISGTEQTAPGTVMVLDHQGALQPSQQAYDKKVAGVISGAGDYRPAIVLDKQLSPDVKRLPIALMGKVYCKVDAQSAPIEVGDLLTTSHTPGHAMKADDPVMAFGAVIGKAMRPLREGQGLIPILIALQ